MADADTRWIKIDDYLERTVATDAAELNPIRQAQEDGGLPDIAVSATQGKFLYLLATIAKARRVLEIGTLGGYSTAWLAKAVEAGLGDRVRVLVGAALESLPAVEGPFDLVFIDADKSNNPGYLDWALRLTEPGAVIVVDNVIRWIGEEGPNAEGTRAALERLGSDPRLDATALQTVGVKGWDGLAIAVVR
ncbi:O-methyltransferase [Mycobacteroides abscessus]|uniref:O-methyltransferase n=1 Tax=Mycobacteroides abscessus TaxID=36809 RepID=UPI000E679B0A|nr:class I SAM-dependent methyltransferase [Mycobacteroides abscessus]RIS61024.1 methyltransferase [Mycobacteroides abscessus]